MKIEKEIIQRIKSFYMIIPRDILIDGIRNQGLSVDTSDLSEIITKIVNKEALNKKFISYLNAKYKTNEHKNSNISKVISSMNEDSFINKFIYILQFLYTNNEDIENFIKSDKYDEYIKKLSSSRENTTDIDEGNNKKFLVHIENTNSFYDIIPLYEIKNDKLRMVNAQSEFPDYGNIMIYPNIKLQEKKYLDNPLWICEYNDNDLLDNDKGDGTRCTKFKLDGDKLVDNKNLYEISQEKIYELVEISGDLYKDKNVEIIQEPITKLVCVKDDDYIYGPFKYIHVKSDNKFYITKESNDFIIKKYSIHKNKNSIKFYENIQDSFNKYEYIPPINIVYFVDEQSIITEEVDTISNEKLVDILIANLNNINIMNIDNDVLGKIKKALPSLSLSESRIEKLEKLLSENILTKDFIENELMNLMEILFENEENKERITEALMKNKIIGEKLNTTKVVEEQIEKKRRELESINVEINSENEKLSQIKGEIKAAKDETINEEIKNKKSELNKLDTEYKNKKKKVEEINEKYNLYDDLDKAKKEYNESQNKLAETMSELKVRDKDLKAKEDEYKEAVNKLDKFEKTISEKINEKLNEKDINDAIAENTFTEIISDEMIKYASNRRKKKEAEDIGIKIGSKENIPEDLEIKESKEDSLIDYLCDTMNIYRNYDRNTVINIMICISQGFLTVFAGQPGVGKTTTCNYIAKSLGLLNDTDFNRYIEVSVEKGWTSKKDLIGYYNPLTKTFDKSNSKLYNAFNILQQEYSDEIYEFPYLVLLDEANLSPMEYYWADFMNVCDLSGENRQINLGEDYVFNIPETLRFIATINYDHTTEILSPRLIDRSWIIMLEGEKQDVRSIFKSSNSKSVAKNTNKIISYKNLINKFTPKEDEEFPEIVLPILESIYKLFNKNKFDISWRVNNMIRNYIITGSKLFKNPDDIAEPEIIALDYAVAQKLLPKISGEGNGFKENFLEALRQIFGENGMWKCKNIIDRIISQGDLNMQYYQFFI